MANLQPRKLKGIESNGMLLSMREMVLGQEHDGIVDLPAEAAVGSPAAGIMGLDDPLFDVAITWRHWEKRAGEKGVRSRSKVEGRART